VVLHTDTSILPASKEAWASWNYRVEPDNQKPTLTYNMNILQQLQKKHTYLVTLNQEIAADKILGTFNYSHPAYTLKTLAAQAQWRQISGADRVHFCGAYWFNGFHEDGVNSALRVCQDLGVTP
jgi:predicted NAD/FAD-binding protein